jgi:hypothetical protein
MYSCSLNVLSSPGDKLRVIDFTPEIHGRVLVYMKVVHWTQICKHLAGNVLIVLICGLNNHIAVWTFLWLGMKLIRGSVNHMIFKKYIINGRT